MKRLSDGWKIFHEQNPHIYDLVDRFTKELIRKGFVNGSIGSIWERIRWEVATTTIGTRSEYTLNNDHRAYYAREWMRLNPQHDGFFRTRTLISEELRVS